MAVKLKPDVFVNTNPFLEAMNKERVYYKGYSDKIAVSINNKKYNVNSRILKIFLMAKGIYLKNVRCGSLSAIFFPALILKKLKA